MSRPRKVKLAATRVVGPNHAVLTLHSEGGRAHLHRREVCAECPWRLDSPLGRFPAGAYAASAPTAYDASFHTFSCHMSGADRPATCAGFILQQGVHNIGVRIALAYRGLDLGKIKRTVPLFETYRAMAVANGVAPDDPALALCRDDAQVDEPEA